MVRCDGKGANGESSMRGRRGERARARPLPAEYVELHRAQTDEVRAGIGQLRDLLADAAARLARGFGELEALARQERASGLARPATCLVPAPAANGAPAAGGLRRRPAPGRSATGAAAVGQRSLGAGEIELF